MTSTIGAPRHLGRSPRPSPVAGGRVASLPPPTPPRGPGGIRAALCALGDAALSPPLVLVVLAALVYAFGERSSEALNAATDAVAGAIAAALG